MSTADAPAREPDLFRVSRWSPRVRWRLLPWWGRVALIYAGARAISTMFLLVLADAQGPNPWWTVRPGYLKFANIWDAGWYRYISYAGYPAELPLTDDGEVAENAWAFLPVYPAIVRALTFLGLPWEAAAVFISLAAGLGAALVFHRLMRRFLDAEQAMFAVVLFCVAPVAPIMQVGYAESIAFLLMALALLLLVERRYGWLVPVVALWAFTRPGALAFALTLGLHFVVRLVRAARGAETFPVRERVLLVGVGLFTALAGLAWPAIAWAATGDPAAYFDTELAWRAAYIGYVELVPFTAWFQGSEWWLGHALGPLGSALVVVALVVGFGVVLFLPWVRRLGTDLRLWLASYALYLLAVFFPQSSTFRLLAPMFPLVGALAVPRARWFRWLLVAVSLVLQFGWLVVCWAYIGRDWTPP